MLIHIVLLSSPTSPSKNYQHIYDLRINRSPTSPPEIIKNIYTKNQAHTIIFNELKIYIQLHNVTVPPTKR